ncbi:MAG: flagellar brake protein [Ectothiorhodospiraceae bacterium]|nr:flagellar brake protein [Ectothiorhodospiraceae bacterium]
MDSRTPGKEDQSDIDYSQQHENITSPARISSLLRPLMAQHAIISATIAESTQFFNTALLAVDPERDVLIIDELNPKTGHSLFINTRRITLHTLLEGVDVSFTVDLIKEDSENGIAFYEVQFPETIRYLQRRCSFRVPVSAADTIPVEIHTKEKSVHAGEISDISTEGMCIRLPKKQNIGLENNTEESQCIIQLSDKRNIQCTFRICHSSQHEPSNNIHIGGHFERLDKIQKRAIERFVIELQRKNRQKMNR